MKLHHKLEVLERDFEIGEMIVVIKIASGYIKIGSIGEIIDKMIGDITGEQLYRVSFLDQNGLFYANEIELL